MWLVGQDGVGDVILLRDRNLGRQISFQIQASYVRRGLRLYSVNR